MTYSKSILQDDMDCCIICGRYGTEIHHIFYGNPNRKWSTKYGCVCGLCYDHHRGKYGVHNGNKELDLKLKRMAQEKFEQVYQNIDFIAVFGRNYLL